MKGLRMRAPYRRSLMPDEPSRMLDSRTATTASGAAAWYYLGFKKTIDLISVIALGVPSLFLLPLLALAIRLDSPGPIFYGQTRVGRNGRHFRIYKLRTMRSDAESGDAVWASAVDSRVTRVGRLLRKTRADELPQLLNILRGEMTLIGPRPERPEFMALLRAELPRYEERHAVTPGITGWAQVNHSYTNTVEGARIKLDLDLYYVAHASLTLDLVILWRTVLVVFRCQGW